MVNLFRNETISANVKNMETIMSKWESFSTLCHFNETCNKNQSFDIFNFTSIQLVLIEVEAVHQ